MTVSTFVFTIVTLKFAMPFDLAKFKTEDRCPFFLENTKGTPCYNLQTAAVQIVSRHKFIWPRALASKFFYVEQV